MRELTLKEQMDRLNYQAEAFQKAAGAAVDDVARDLWPEPRTRL